MHNFLRRLVPDAVIDARHRRLRRQRGRAQAAAAREARPGEVELFAAVERFCLFVGYPRSGHSLVGSLIDAHRHAVVAHELNALRFVANGRDRDELFRLILWREERHGELGRTSTGYDYTVPGQWQGRAERLRVIGDKRGTSTSRRLAGEPELLDQLETTVRVPVHIVHVVRNPFDNISTMATRAGRSLDAAATTYFELLDVTASLRPRLPAGRWLDVFHEDLIAEPSSTLHALCAFFDLDAPDDYVEACAGILFESPRRTRDRPDWTPELADRVRRRIDDVPFLERYGSPEALPA